MMPPPNPQPAAPSTPEIVMALIQVAEEQDLPILFDAALQLLEHEISDFLRYRRL